MEYVNQGAPETMDPPPPPPPPPQALSNPNGKPTGKHSTQTHQANSNSSNGPDPSLTNLGACSSSNAGSNFVNSSSSSSSYNTGGVSSSSSSSYNTGINFSTSSSSYPTTGGKFVMFRDKTNENHNGNTVAVHKKSTITKGGGSKKGSSANRGYSINKFGSVNKSGSVNKFGTVNRQGSSASKSSSSCTNKRGSSAIKRRSSINQQGSIGKSSTGINEQGSNGNKSSSTIDTQGSSSMNVDINNVKAGLSSSSSEGEAATTTTINTGFSSSSSSSWERAPTSPTYFASTTTAAATAIAATAITTTASAITTTATAISSVITTAFTAAGTAVRGTGKGRPTTAGSQPRSRAAIKREENIQDMVDEIKSRNLNNGGGRQAKGGRWMAEEDEALRAIVGRDGEGKWKSKANELNRLMEAQYKSLRLSAADSSDPPVEYGRVAAQCLHRWKKVLQPGLNKGHWTDREDNIVRETVGNAEAIDTKVKWSSVASMLPGRLGKQCRERWFNHLDPSVKKSEWTSREDEVLFNSQVFFGTRWCEIAKLLPGRTENAVKNRYNSSAKQRWETSEAGRGADRKTSRLFLEKLKITLKNATAADSNKRDLDSVPAREARVPALPPPDKVDKPTKKSKNLLEDRPSKKKSTPTPTAHGKSFDDNNGMTEKSGKSFGDDGGAFQPAVVSGGKLNRTGPKKSRSGAGGRLGAAKRATARATKEQKAKKKNGTAVVTNGDVVKAAAKAARAAERKRAAEQREANKKAVKAAVAATPAKSSPAGVADIVTKRPRSRLGKDLMIKAGRTDGGSSSGGGGDGGSGGGGGTSSPHGVRKETEWSTGADAARKALRKLDKPIPTPTQSATTTTGNTTAGTDTAVHQAPSSPPSRPPHLIRQQQSPPPTPPPPQQEITKSFPSEMVPPTAPTNESIFPANSMSCGVPCDATAGGGAAVVPVQPLPVVSPTWPSWAPLDGQDYSADIDMFFSDDISASALPFSPEMWTEETAATTAAAPAVTGGRLGNDNLFAATAAAATAAATAAAATATTTTAPNVGPWYGQNTGGGTPAQSDPSSCPTPASDVVAKPASDVAADGDEEFLQDAVLIPAKSTPAGVVAEDIFGATFNELPLFTDSFVSPASSPRGTVAPISHAPLHAVATAVPTPSINNTTGVADANMEQHGSPLPASSSSRAPAPAPVPEVPADGVGGRDVDLPNWAIESVVPGVVEASPVSNNNAAAAAAAIGGGNGSSNIYGAQLAESEYMDLEDDIMDDANMDDGNMEDGNVYGTTTDSPAVLMGSPFDLDGGGGTIGATPY